MAIIKSSTNKTTWTTATVTGTGSTTWATSTIHSVAYSNGIWAAGNDQNQVAVSNTLGAFGIPQLLDSSNTGTSWTTVNSNFGGTINNIDYGNGLWLFVGYIGSNTAAMRTSTNGSTWTTVTDTSDNIPVAIAYGNGRWVEVGLSFRVRFSTNGSAWTSVFSNVQTDIASVAYGNGIWIFGSSVGQMRTSTNGSTWTTVTTSNFAGSIRSIAYGNNLWVAGGTAGRIRTSTNGVTWTTVTSNFASTFAIQAIGYGNGRWIAGGSNGAQMRTSTDGSTWTTVNPIWDSGAFQSIRAIKHSNNLWIAAGYISPDGVSAVPVMRKSTDGFTWTTVNSSFGTPNAISSIAYGQNLWAAVGLFGSVRTSPQLYSTLNLPNTQISSFNTQFMAVSNNRPQSSTDGITWTTLSGFGAVHVNKFVESNGKHVLLGNSGVLYEKNTSTTTWTTRSTGISDNFLNAAVNPSGHFIVRGNNALYRSTNLTTWTTISKPPASSVNDIIAK